MNNEGTRELSTARKLKYMWIGKLIISFLVIDILIGIIFFAASFYYAEKQGFGEFYFGSERSMGFEESNITYESIFRDDENKQIRIIAERGLDNVVYQVLESGEILYENNLNTELLIISRVVHWILIIELIIIAGEFLSSVKKIRRKLQPIHDIAETANRLSNISFDETKVHELEKAIAKISPSGPNGSLHTADEDLKGLEEAINNLLERMRASYKQQSRFVSDASHELRTPIAVIQGYVNMLDRWGKEDETVLQESIEAIKNESEHMKKLVEQLLFLARGDSGRTKLKFEKVSLYDMIQEVYEESIMIDEKHSYQFSGDENVRISADMSMLKQAVRILVDNAAKYTIKEDVIILKCGKNHQNIPYISVQDNGIGMKEEDISHVFERFYRSDEARDKRMGGTGLGLSIAKWIIEKHEGYFEILSREDLGTRITILLPEKHLVDGMQG